MNTPSPSYYNQHTLNSISRDNIRDRNNEYKNSYHSRTLDNFNPINYYGNPHPRDDLQKLDYLRTVNQTDAKNKMLHQDLAIELEKQAIKGGYTHPLITDLGYGQANKQMKGHLLSKNSFSKLSDNDYTNLNPNGQRAQFNPHFDYLPKPVSINDAKQPSVYYDNYIETMRKNTPAPPSHYANSHRNPRDITMTEHVHTGYNPMNHKIHDYSQNTLRSIPRHKTIAEEIEHRTASLQYLEQKPFSSNTSLYNDKFYEQHLTRTMDYEYLDKHHLDNPEQYDLQNVVLPIDMRISKNEEFWFLQSQIIVYLRDIEAARKHLMMSSNDLDVHELFRMINKAREIKLVQFIDIKDYFLSLAVKSNRPLPIEQSKLDELFKNIDKIFFYPKFPMDFENFRYWFLGEDIYNHTYVNTHSFNSWSYELQNDVLHLFVTILNCYFEIWKLRKIAKMRGVSCLIERETFPSFREKALNNRVWATTGELKIQFNFLGQGKKNLERVDIDKFITNLDNF